MVMKPTLGFTIRTLNFLCRVVSLERRWLLIYQSYFALVHFGIPLWRLIFEILLNISDKTSSNICNQTVQTNLNNGLCTSWIDHVWNIYSYIFIHVFNPILGFAKLVSKLEVLPRWKMIDFLSLRNFIVFSSVISSSS